MRTIRTSPRSSHRRILRVGGRLLCTPQQWGLRHRPDNGQLQPGLRSTLVTRLVCQGEGLHQLCYLVLSDLQREMWMFSVSDFIWRATDFLFLRSRAAWNAMMVIVWVPAQTEPDLRGQWRGPVILNIRRSVRRDWRLGQILLICLLGNTRLAVNEFLPLKKSVSFPLKARCEGEEGESAKRSGNWYVNYKESCSVLQPSLPPPFHRPPPRPSGEIRPKHGSPKRGFALISDLNCNKSEKRIEIKIPSLIRTAKSPIRQGSGNAYFIWSLIVLCSSIQAHRSWRSTLTSVAD